ncbi:MAG TPA: hypothetical protein ENL20_00730 [Candidatus Cloacimonetes bacterium]|nr:hypothetical protein [Candidatus Cloacimonadota bacterium]
MATNKPIEVDELFGELIPAENDQKWEVIYTKPKREKKLAEYSKRNKINYFLPLKDSIRKYGNREVKFTKPLFPGYIFIKHSPQQKQKLIISGHIVNFLRVQDEKSLLKDLQQIYISRTQRYDLRKHEYLEKGIKVRIIAGSLVGMEGVVSDKSKLNEVILKVNILKQAVSVTVDPNQVEIIRK